MLPEDQSREPSTSVQKVLNSVLGSCTSAMPMLSASASSRFLLCPGLAFQPFSHLLDRGLTGADVLGCDAGVVAGPLDAIPRIRAVRSVVGDAVPLGEVARVALGGGGQLGAEAELPLGPSRAGRR